MTVSAFAPGKLILLGEHAVVDGHPAIAAAVDLGTTVTLRDRPGVSGLDRCALVDARLWPALSVLVPDEGVGVEIESTLPVGCGMGSSAALAVALVRALAKREGREADFDECWRLGFEVERAFHGTPSGIDHTVSALGGVVRYRRVDGRPEVRALDLSSPLELVVANTGAPGNTAEMVARVRARGAEPEFRAIAALVEAAPAAWPSLGPLFRANHLLLRAIGVSTPELDRACAVMEGAGAAGAKLAGAGGGGVAIGLVDGPSREPVLAAARAAGFVAFPVRISPRPP